MAGPGELVQLISATTGVPLATLTDIDRRLVKAGLRRKTGRGRHAARMSPLDAACLLTGMLASAQAISADETVGRYAATTVDPARSSAGLFGATGIADLGQLTARHGFVDGLAALIASAGTGSIAALIKASAGDALRIEIFAFTRATAGRIRLSGLPNGATASLEYGPANKSNPRRTANRDPGNDDATGDLEQSRRITERTILPVARLLSDEVSS